jgi:hypothetical protein
MGLPRMLAFQALHFVTHCAIQPHFCRRQRGRLLLPCLLVLRQLPDGCRLCPLQTHRRRYLFNHVHHWMGRIAIVLTIVAIYLGLRLSNVGAPCGHLECCMSGS